MPWKNKITFSKAKKDWSRWHAGQKQSRRINKLRAGLWAAYAINLVGIYDGFVATARLYPDMPELPGFSFISALPLGIKAGAEIGAFASPVIINGDWGQCSRWIVERPIYNVSERLFGRTATALGQFAMTVVAMPGRTLGGATFGFAEGVYSIGHSRAPVTNLAKCGDRPTFDRSLQLKFE